MAENKSVYTLTSNNGVKLKDSIPCRIDFIKDLIKNQPFISLIENNDNDNSENSNKTYDTRIKLKKSILDFTNVINNLG